MPIVTNRTHRAVNPGLRLAEEKFIMSHRFHRKNGFVCLSNLEREESRRVDRETSFQPHPGQSDEPQVEHGGDGQQGERVGNQHAGDVADKEERLEAGDEIAGR